MADDFIAEGKKIKKQMRDEYAEQIAEDVKVRIAELETRIKKLKAMLTVSVIFLALMCVGAVSILIVFKSSLLPDSRPYSATYNDPEY